MQWFVLVCKSLVSPTCDVMFLEQVQAAQADGVDYAPDGKAHRPVLPVCADVVAEVRGVRAS